LQQHEDNVVIVLQTINSILKHKLIHNPHFTYQLLHRHELFESFHLAHNQNSRFKNLLLNILSVITYFTNVLVKAQYASQPNDSLPQTGAIPSVDWTSAQVLETIKHTSLLWKADTLLVCHFSSKNAKNNFNETSDFFVVKAIL
jgi:hypothetical protein